MGQLTPPLFSVEHTERLQTVSRHGRYHGMGGSPSDWYLFWRHMQSYPLGAGGRKMYNRQSAETCFQGTPPYRRVHVSGLGGNIEGTV